MLKGVTGGYRELQEISRDYRGYRVLQSVFTRILQQTDLLQARLPWLKQDGDQVCEPANIRPPAKPLFSLKPLVTKSGFSRCDLHGLP